MVSQQDWDMCEKLLNGFLLAHQVAEEETTLNYVANALGVDQNQFAAEWKGVQKGYHTVSELLSVYRGIIEKEKTKVVMQPSEALTLDAQKEGS